MATESLIMPEQVSLPRKIVATVDGSVESMAAAAFAIELSRSLGAQLVALHVIHLPEYVSDDVRTRVRDELRAKGQVALDAARESARAKGIEMSAEVIDTTSSVVDAICDFASMQKGDMIILGTRGEGGVAKLMLGSVAAGVARSARCPVLVVR